MSNDSVNKAKVEKNDEFYTLFEDIEKELIYYKNYFKNKVVYCNCDDPYKSNFFKYFALNFDSLGLKRLICTCYAEKQYKVDLFGTLNNCTTLNKYPYKAELNSSIKDYDGDGVVTLNDVELYLKDKNHHDITLLKGNGDFRSSECIEILNESDIVVTNPPFSLFREFIVQLMKYGKQFIILGNMNAVTYKEIFPLLMENQVWLGYHGGHTWFGTPDEYQVPERYLTTDKKKMRSNGYMIDENGCVWRNLGNICWFTNLDIPKRHQPLNLYGNYLCHADKYPKYDNYDAINVDRVEDIPCDYTGIMGVPITFIDKYCSEQFELIGHESDLCGNGGDGLAEGAFIVNGIGVYKRILIRKKARK